MYLPRTIDEIMNSMIQALPHDMALAVKTGLESNIRSILQSIAASILETELQISAYMEATCASCQMLQEQPSKVASERQPIGRPAAPWKTT